MYAIILFFALAISGCGKDSTIESFRDAEFFAPPEPGDLISPRWIRVSDLLVKGYPDYNAHVEIAVKGVMKGASIECQIITSHVRFRADRLWSPLPIALFSDGYDSPDGKEDLHHLFRETLDFEEKVYDTQKVSTRVRFTRGKTFMANWNIYPLMVRENGALACSAVATVQASSQVKCKESICRIRAIVAEVNVWAHLWGGGDNEKAKDDLSSLTLDLEGIDAQGYPNGDQYSVPVPEWE